MFLEGVVLGSWDFDHRREREQEKTPLIKDTMFRLQRQRPRAAHALHSDQNILQLINSSIMSDEISAGKVIILEQELR
jgi:hypothetical protein